jgi:hypothetical protein
MEEISPIIQGIRMLGRGKDMHQLVLIAPNAMWADVLHHTLGQQVILTYTYDGAGITYYLRFELPGIGKMFKVAVGSFTQTLQWLNWIDEKTVTDIRVCYRDGKGGLIPYGATVALLG